jgi:DUF971 family protein
MRPTSIKKINPAEIQIIWTDGHESSFTFELLRDICPCAGCSGETILLHEYKAPPQSKTTPGRYDLKSIQQVGSYAVQLSWGDGHNTGIYTWEHLLSNCPCNIHSKSNQ